MDGFFNGATDVISQIYNRGRNDAEVLSKPIIIDGQTYIYSEHEHSYARVRKVIENDPFPEALKIFTLSGMIKYINDNVDGMIKEDQKYILQVVNETAVVLLTEPIAPGNNRCVIAECRAHCPDFRYGSYMDTENFNTQLLSKFVETDARAEVFKVVKSMVKEQTMATSDDGVSQVITVKQGVASCANVQFQNPVPLKPMRTFTEVDQPESNFVLRVNGDGFVSLTEADGGAWRNVAVENIANYLKLSIKAVNVVVIA